VRRVLQGWEAWWVYPGWYGRVYTRGVPPCLPTRAYIPGNTYPPGIYTRVYLSCPYTSGVPLLPIYLRVYLRVAVLRVYLRVAVLRVYLRVSS